MHRRDVVPFVLGRYLSGATLMNLLTPPRTCPGFPEIARLRHLLEARHCVDNIRIAVERLMESVGKKARAEGLEQ